MLKKKLLITFSISLFLGALYSCNQIVGSTTTANAGEHPDQKTEMEEAGQQDTLYLMDKLDSLNRNLILFPPVDSLNKIDPKQAKRNLRD